MSDKITYYLYGIILVGDRLRSINLSGLALPAFIQETQGLQT